MKIINKLIQVEENIKLIKKKSKNYRIKISLKRFKYNYTN